MQRLAVSLIVVLALAGCRTQVEVAPPKEPIVIELNVKVDHEIRVKVDKELEDAFAENPELFGGGAAKGGAR